MQIPIFFEDNISAKGNLFLGEETSRHIIQVLRMAEGEEILLTNGKGDLLTATIISANKRKTEVNVTAKNHTNRQNSKVSVAMSLIKNSSRFEWFLEKATEIGVSEIIPMLCSRTEKQQFKQSRMNTIMNSAMLQSRQTWLPELKEPVNFSDLIRASEYGQSFIAHCSEGEKKPIHNIEKNNSSILILIGPEGDFTSDEINLALDNNFTPVSLGETRLRTETAGLVAAVLLLNR